MEWTKVKPKHFLFTDLDMKQKGCLITLLCLTAHLERMPTEKEMVKATHYMALKALRQVLDRCLIDLRQVLDKVLEDVSKVKHDKTLNAERQTRYRKSHIESNALHNAIDKIREERIDSNTNTKASRLTDAEFITSIKNNSAYKGINIDAELAKMDAWLMTRPGRQKTQRFIINWLNKVDRPLQIQGKERSRV